jgi:hypothetical protein
MKNSRGDAFASSPESGITNDLAGGVGQLSRMASSLNRGLRRGKRE